MKNPFNCMSTRSRSRSAICILSLALSSLLWISSATGVASAYPSLRLDGPEELVSESNMLGCKDADGTVVTNDHSDMPARAFRDYTGEVHMLAGSRQNFQLTGPTLDKVARRSCDRAVVSRNNPAPEAFDHFQWLMSAYTEDGKTVFGLTHHEYHGRLYVPECKNAYARDGSWQMRCWYTSVNLLVSHDGGKTFNAPGGKPRPIAVIPYRFSTDMNRAGPHSPTNIVKQPTEKNYYVMFQVSAYRDQARGTCVMRATDLEKADWRAWGGKAFDVEFANPYVSTIFDPKRHICTPVVPWLATSLTYNTSAKAFLLVGYWTEGAVYAWSRDLVRWSEGSTLMDTLTLPLAVRKRASEATAHFSALDPSSPTPNFDQTGARFFLYYTKYFEPLERGERRWGFAKRQLVRRLIVVQ